VSVGRRAVDRLGAAFLTGDADAVLAEFVADEDVLYAGSELGEVAVGRGPLRELLEELVGRDERYSWVAGTVHEVATDDRVHVVAEAELTVHAGGPDRWRPAERLPYRLSGVLERGPGASGAWRWRSCQGSEPVTGVA
jgi:SnoaL-like domain